MKPNLNKIAKELYGKIQTRFTDIEIGDENAEVLSKKQDVPLARFFEFEYKERGRAVGTIAITLDEEDGIIVQVSGNIAEKKHPGAYRFIRSFRQFAKNRLLNFDVQNIGKNNLEKRDYTFQAKKKELPMMEPIMENRLYGTARMSYQDLGEAKLIIKHSQPINLDLAAGRSMHIENIWVENAMGERFRYPAKHINGARALAEHIKHGGHPYDAIGQHIISLSEELAQLRKFKGYVSRNEALSEAMGDITSKVLERIEQVKKEVNSLQRTAYYEQFAEAFTDREEQMIPEEIMSDWIDRLTIRTFNEELKTAFPYIFKLVSEADIPVTELNPDDLLDEVFDGDKETGTTHKGAKVTKTSHGIKHTKSKYDDSEKPDADMFKADTGRHAKAKLDHDAHDIPNFRTDEDQFESFIDQIVSEDEDQEGRGILDQNTSTALDAVKKLNDIFKTELKGGVAGINIIDSLKDLIPDPEFLAKMKDVDPDLDARSVIEYELKNMSQSNEDLARAVSQLDFGGASDDEIGGKDVETPPPAPEAPATQPDASAPPSPEVPPGAPPAPVAESMGNIAGLKAKLIKALEAGATLETRLDFGHTIMTLGEACDACGITMDKPDTSGDPVHDILKSIAGFWNPKEKNFTIGGTRAKIKVLKGFKDGEFPHSEPEHVKKVIDMIEKMDPTKNDELGRIKQLSGTMQVEDVQDDFDAMMKDFTEKHGNIDIDSMLTKFKQDNPDATVTQSNTQNYSVNGKPSDKSGFDAAQKNTNMPKFNLDDPEGMQGHFKNFASQIMPQMAQKVQSATAGQKPQDIKMPGFNGSFNPADFGNHISNMMKGMNFNEANELAKMLKIAGIGK